MSSTRSIGESSTAPIRDTDSEHSMEDVDTVAPPRAVYECDKVAVPVAFLCASKELARVPPAAESLTRLLLLPVDLEA